MKVLYTDVDILLLAAWCRGYFGYVRFLFRTNKCFLFFVSIRLSRTVKYSREIPGSWIHFATVLTAFRRNIIQLLTFRVPIQWSISVCGILRLFSFVVWVRVVIGREWRFGVILCLILKISWKSGQQVRPNSGSSLPKCTDSHSWKQSYVGVFSFAAFSKLFLGFIQPPPPSQLTAGGCFIADKAMTVQCQVKACRNGLAFKMIHLLRCNCVSRYLFCEVCLINPTFPIMRYYPFSCGFFIGIVSWYNVDI
jgi:hypothetical protein